MADVGRLFLGEACSFAPSLQAKLLRAIEHDGFWRVGGWERRRSRFRLVTAVAEPMDELLASGAWRPDLAHRGSHFTITVPPLRARQRDVPLLAGHFLEAMGNGHPPKRLTPEATEVLRRYRWPGNVRELKALMERLQLIVQDPMIDASAVTAALSAVGRSQPPGAEQLFRILASTGWNIGKAARALGISRSTLYRRIKENGLAIPDDRAPVS